MNTTKYIACLGLLLATATMPGRLWAGEKQTSSLVPLKVLLLTGQNNHNWKQTTPVLKHTLEKAGAFVVTVVERPETLQPGAFAGYDLVLSNWNTFPKNPKGVWDAATRSDFLKYIESGKGFVVVHAGGAMFYDWPEYQKLIGATWGKGSRHGKIFPFKVSVVDRAHPITQAMPAQYDTVDEVWASMVVNGERHILLTAPSDRTNKDEPVCFTTTMSHGRCFNLVLGAEAAGMQNRWFQTLLRRGCEWAATGDVTGRTLSPVE